MFRATALDVVRGDGLAASLGSERVAQAVCQLGAELEPSRRSPSSAKTRNMRACQLEPKQRNMPGMSKTDIPAAAGGDDDASPLEQVPELVIGPPFLVCHDVDLMERGGEVCAHCNQPEVSGAVAILRCDCGQLFRINLLDVGGHPAQCPKCDKKYTHVLIVAESDNPEAFPEAVACVLGANGYKVALPDELDDDDDADDDDDDAGDDEIDDDDANAPEHDDDDDDAGDGGK
jgi:hypothetical protein